MFFFTDTNSTQYVGCFQTIYSPPGSSNRVFMKNRPESLPGNINQCIGACGYRNYTYAGGEVEIIQKLDPIKLYPVNVVSFECCILLMLYPVNVVSCVYSVNVVSCECYIL